MTQDEYNKAAALVVRLRKELEDATQDLSLHYDALKLSNAQCAEYLRQNEQLRADVSAVAEGLKQDISILVDAGAAEYNKLHSELVDVRAALSATTEQRDSLKRTLDEWSNADTKPHERVAADDVADHVVPPVLPLCNVCHGCGMPLGASAKGPYLWCTNFSCNRKTTQYRDHDASPYWGPCKSATPVRHE